MDVSITDPNTQLPELVALAQSGEDVVLTSDGKPVARLTVITTHKSPSRSARRALIEELQAQVAAKNLPNLPEAARSQNFLFDDDGLPA